MVLYNTDDAAALAGVHYKRLWYALATGKLKETVKVGRIRFFDEQAVTTIRQFFAERDVPEVR